MASRDGLVVAKSSFFAGNRLVRAGDVWVGDDAVVRHYPVGFKPLEVRSSADPSAGPVSTPKSTATARPGSRKAGA